MKAVLHPENILIVTATKVETQAVLESFAPGKTWERERVGPKFYYSLGMHGGIWVYLVQSEMGTATPGGSLLTVRRAIQHLGPRAVIMCGIAFGANKESQELGEILISRQLEYYEPQKEDLKQGPIFRGDRVTVSEPLLDRCRSADIEWKGAKTYIGLVLSGEKLVNHPSFLRKLLKHAPEAVGGEMEGAGLYAAARDGSTEWILVKAICDWADGEKNSKAQPLAARNAADFVLQVVGLGDWNVDTPAASSKPQQRQAPPSVSGKVRELCDIMADQSRSVKDRVEAGKELWSLGDPRFRADAWFLPGDDLLGFVEIPAGPFLMGSEAVVSGRLAISESPQHPVDLPLFYLGRFPVTNAQYQAFLKENGTWKPPEDGLVEAGNQPAVSVSWYEAMQYCRWLERQLHSGPDIPGFLVDLLAGRKGDGIWTVTLPSEAEWEKAARGMADARLFPWGPLPSPTLANQIESALRATSPVGCFEGGRSPFGVEDMSGNAWEWTRSNWGSNMDVPLYKYPYRPADGREDTRAARSVLRVLRGGSFLSGANELRCSHRTAELPDTRGEHIGFRLAVVMQAREDS